MINETVNGGFQPRAPVSESKPVLRAAPDSTTPVSASQTAEPAGVASAEPTDKAPIAQVEQLEAAAETLNDHVQSLRRTLSFNVEESTGRTVISVYDAETQELIRQIPPEEALQLAAAIEQQADTHHLLPKIRA